MSWLRRRFEEDKPLCAAIAAHAALQLALACWDLPGAHGWENDGVAPRDLFGGLAGNLTPGAAHRYPLLHYAIVGLFAAPVLVVGALGADAWTRAALERALLGVAVMTGVSFAAKVVAVVMGAVALFALGRLGRRLVSPRAGRCAVLLAALNVSIAYYGRTSNLDGPYLMWSLLALDRLVDVVRRGRAGDRRAFALFAAAAVATKDQAYGLFVVVAPLAFVALPALRPSSVAGRAARARQALGTAGLACAAYALLSGALLNPLGFVRRLGLLTGTNSQDWAAYSPGWAGLVANARDLVAAQALFFWPWPVVALGWAGVVIAVRARGDGPTRALRAAPLVAALSFVVSFTLLVRRSEHRFLLPLGFALCFYGGAALDAALRAAARLPPAARALTLATGALTLLPAVRPPIGLALSQMNDGRRAVERWLDERLAQTPDAHVELHGPLVYLPRLDPAAIAGRPIMRFEAGPVARRNPLAGAIERQGTLDGLLERRPDVLVVPEAFLERLLPTPLRDGHTPPRAFDERRPPAALDVAARLASDRLPGYRLALHAGPVFPRWALALGIEPIRIQGSVGYATSVFVRTETAPPRGGRHGE